LGTKVTSTGIAALAKLKHLQQFLFREMPSFSREDIMKKRTDLCSICVWLMPWLHVIGSTMGLSDSVECKLNWRDVERVLKRRLPSQLGLRQLSLYEPSGMPVGVALPNLETLIVTVPIFSEKLFQLKSAADLPSLTNLVLENVKQELFEKIISQIGQQLRKLSVSVWGTLILNKVFLMCPNLQLFYAKNYHMGSLELVEPLVESVLSELTELAFFTCYCQSVSTFPSNDQLLQILRAVPNLRILQLENYIFSQLAVRDIGRELSKHSILQHLQKFDLYHQWPEEDRSWLPEKNNCHSMIQIMILLCPKLTSV